MWHDRNEPLDIRNYARAGLKIIDPDMDAVAARLKGAEKKPDQPAAQKKRRGAVRNRAAGGDDW